MIFYQFFEQESSTYTYLLGDETTKDAILIDPVIETIERDLKQVEELGLNLVFIADTHIHADHVTAAGAIRDRRRGQTKTAVSARAGVDCSDVALKDGDVLAFGSYELKVLETPGHTDSCLSLYLKDDGRGQGMVFTGDALLIRGTGRTDFQQGSSEALFESVTRKLFTLPDDTLVFPAHDYRGHTRTTIGLEKAFNPRLGGGRTKEQFVKIMGELNLAHPKKIHEALPANMSCGKRINDPTNAQAAGAEMFKARTENGIPEITPEDLSQAMKQPEWKSQVVRLIDVRRPDEYVGEFGHVEGAELVTLGPDLQNLIDNGNAKETVVFLCRSGGRSGQATQYALQKGYQNVFNMRGGMIRWTELALPATK